MCRIITEQRESNYELINKKLQYNLNEHVDVIRGVRLDSPVIIPLKQTLSALITPQVWVSRLPMYKDSTDSSTSLPLGIHGGKQGRRQSC